MKEWRALDATSNQPWTGLEDRGSAVGQRAWRAVERSPSLRQSLAREALSFARSPFRNGFHRLAGASNRPWYLFKSRNPERSRRIALIGLRGAGNPRSARCWWHHRYERARGKKRCHPSGGHHCPTRRSGLRSRDLARPEGNPCQPRGLLQEGGSEAEHQCASTATHLCRAGRYGPLGSGRNGVAGDAHRLTRSVQKDNGGEKPN